MGIPIANYQVASMTGGLVGETAVTHLVLPSIKPPYTMALVLMSLVVSNVNIERYLTCLAHDGATLESTNKADVPLEHGLQCNVLLHVWMACPREGNLDSTYTFMAFGIGGC